MAITLSQDVAAQIRDALVAALHSRGGDLEQEGKPLGQTKREQEKRLREAIRLLDEQQESAALAKALLATPAHFLANLEAALSLALARARDRICTDPGKAEYDSSQAQALKQLEKFHTDVRQIMAMPPR
jgi:hypothetical protein